MAVPNIFGTATAAIPLSQLDQNFATAITLGNTAVYLGNTTTSLGNVTLTNVTISSGTSNIAANVSTAVGLLPEANGGTGTTTGYYGFKNRIIDGGFIINQRAYVSNTALSAGVYAHDRWKAGASGCTYTFTQGSLGVNTTITITAGTLVQVIEGCNLAEGGTYVLSWTGTAQGRLNGGTYGSSGTVTVTGWTAGTNLDVEFNTGTVGSVQLEKGSTATSFDYRPYGTELALCERYLERCQYSILGYAAAGQFVSASVNFRAVKRATPTLSAVNEYSSNVGSEAFPYVNSAYGMSVWVTAAATGSVDFRGYFFASAEL